MRTNNQKKERYINNKDDFEKKILLLIKLNFFNLNELNNLVL